jgi:hypothetical protein
MAEPTTHSGFQIAQSTKQYLERGGRSTLPGRGYYWERIQYDGGIRSRDRSSTTTTIQWVREPRLEAQDRERKRVVWMTKSSGIAVEKRSLTVKR